MPLRMLDTLNFFTPIENKKFIDVAINFAINKKDDNGYIEKQFNAFNGIRLPIEEEKQLNLPKGITLAKAYETSVFLPDKGAHSCKRNKEFRIIKTEEGKSFQENHGSFKVVKSPKNTISVSFQPISKYSP